ncbi:DUF4245 family protein [Aeromicrobium senzhongii]|uniref:DUF4245 family protein n=1 Tax=Aeromicrobium senzhongii TaxID=2663859 RepID=A0ABX6SUI9_9ACTN|nr:DUF4245 family protein [Aeromicrobium senzhongii]MTB87910.1 DUF4245 family protein [Aeromicrobium senzhongii]QNL95071.1 DUF4245 family protein [Aeromicrobium senzhongii]
MSGYSRGVPAMGDVLRSVLVLGAVVVGLFLFGRLLTVTPDNPTSEVDWRTAASGVESRAGFVPLVPAEVPDRWRVTRAELIDDRWQLNVITEKDKYVGLSQRRGDAKALSALVEDRAPGAKPAGDVRIDGQSWQVGTGPKGAVTLSRLVGGDAVVVTGNAGQSVIEDYVASLEPFSS